MKRIVEQPSQPLSNVCLVLGEESMEPTAPLPNIPVPKPVYESIPVEIPPRHLFNSDLKDLSGFREMRRQLKIKNSLNEFVSETSKILSLFSSKDRKYDAKMVQFVAEMAENFFVTHTKMGEIKEKAVIETVKCFYNNDVELVKSIIQLVLPFIKKTNLARRMKFRVSRFFLVIASSLFHKE